MCAESKSELRDWLIKCFEATVAFSPRSLMWRWKQGGERRGQQAPNEASGSTMGSGATPKDCPSPLDFVKTVLWWGQRCPWQQFCPHNQPGGLDLPSQF